MSATEATTMATDIPRDQRYEKRTLGGGVKVRMPTTAWAERLRELFSAHVKPLDPDSGWKGPCEALVSPELAADVAEAMNFMGALVAKKTTRGDKAYLYSDGYWANGF